MDNLPETNAIGQSILKGDVTGNIRAGLPSTATGVQVEVTNAPSAVEVAKYFLQLAASEDEPEYLTHMRLQKLLYYAQGWSLAMRDRPMFPERIEAWAHGPVVKKVYPMFASFGDAPIPFDKVGAPEKLTREDKEFIASVWEAYKVYSATSLRNMTHNEAPWKDARNGCAPADRCSNEITHDAMKRFFGGASRREQEKR
jgi:uncharacterized phage-associated protein